jgi:competence protein ComEA
VNRDARIFLIGAQDPEGELRMHCIQFDVSRANDPVKDEALEFAHQLGTLVLLQPRPKVSQQSSFGSAKPFFSRKEPFKQHDRNMRKQPALRSKQILGNLMVDLNTATAKELDSVPALKGHGFDVVRYRDERGRFTSLRQLEEVPGLSGKTDGIADQVTVADS